MQCYVDTGATNPNETYWYETIDFCYVREVDFWESLFDRKYWAMMRRMRADSRQNTDSRLVRCLRVEVGRRLGSEVEFPPTFRAANGLWKTLVPWQSISLLIS